MRIVRKKRSEVSSRIPQRVFFCYDSKNNGEINEIISDIHSAILGLDYWVSYVDDPTADADLMKYELHYELQRTTLFVVWITKELLDTADAASAWPQELLLAREIEVPIIPLVNQSELWSRYTALLRKFGGQALHGLNMTHHDYKQKLAIQMHGVLMAKSLADDVERKAFDAKAFLSYRKANIDEAKSFLQDFHVSDRFISVSVWFDSYLTAGEGYNAEIEKYIADCDVFILLVTPELLEEGNYVLRIEYPTAKRLKKPIIPIEAKTADYEILKELCPNMQKPIKADDYLGWVAVFSDIIGVSPIIEEMYSEQSELLGMAYQHGYGVERDSHKAATLLANASKYYDDHAFRAASMLSAFYEHIRADYREAYKWRKRVVEIAEQLHGKEHPKTYHQYSELGNLCVYCNNHMEALNCYKNALPFYEKEKNDNALASIFGSMGTAYQYLGQRENAMDYTRKALWILEAQSGPDLPGLAVVYDNIGSMILKAGGAKLSLGWFGKALSIKEQILGELDPGIAISYANFALAYSMLGKFEESVEWIDKALFVTKKVLGMKHPDTIGMLNTKSSILTKRSYYRWVKAIILFITILLSLGIIFWNLNTA